MTDLIANRHLSVLLRDIFPFLWLLNGQKYFLQGTTLPAAAAVNDSGKIELVASFSPNISLFNICLCVCLQTCTWASLPLNSYGCV